MHAILSEKKTLFMFAAVVMVGGIVLGFLSDSYFESSPPLPKSQRHDTLSALQWFRSCEVFPFEGQFDRSPRYACYQRAFFDGMKEHGLAVISEAFDSYIATKEGMVLQGAPCHSLGHDLGQAAIMIGYDGLDILTHCSSACEGGCFNGVGHTYLTLGNSIESVDGFCNPPDYAGDKKRVSACYHGFGHGITDLFGTDLQANLDRCDVLQDEEGRFQCGHAVFMVLSTLSPEQIQRSTMPQDIASFCVQVDATYRRSCFIFAGYLAYGRTLNPKEAFATCRRVPSDYQRECTARIGESLFLATPNDPLFVAESCSEGYNEEMISLCISGAAKTVIADTNSTPEVGFAICNTAPDAFRAYCHERLGDVIEEFLGIQNRITLCKELGGPFHEVCLGQRSQEL